METNKNLNTYYRLLKDSYDEESFKDFKRRTKKQPEETIYRMLIEDEELIIKKKKDSYVQLDPITNKENIFQKEDTTSCFVLEPIMDNDLQKTENIEQNFPIGTYRKFVISEAIDKVIDEESDDLKYTTYYLLNIPQIDKQTNFYRKNSNISATQTSLIHDEFRNSNSLANQFILFAVNSDKREGLNYEKIEPLLIFKPNSERLKNILPLFESEEKLDINRFLFEYISDLKTKSTLQEKQLAEKLETEIKSKETIINEKESINELIQTNDLSLKKSWTYDFYNDLIYSYGKTKEHYSPKKEEYKNNAVFYQILTKQVGLSMEEAELTLIDIQNYYTQIKRNQGNDRKNISFLDLYYEYKELVKDDELKKTSNELIETLTKLTSENSNEVKKNEKRNEIAINFINYNKENFETDLLLGNIKFPQEYQDFISSTFNNLKKTYEESIVLDIIKNKKTVDFVMTDDLAELKSFGNSLEKYDIADEIKDDLILIKYRELKQETNLFKNNENFINKYISNQIIPREYKLEQILNMINVKDGQTSVLYKNELYSLVAEKEDTNDSIHFKIIFHFEKEDCETEIATSQDFLYITKAIGQIKKCFKEDENFDDFIDKTYNDYYFLNHTKELNQDSIKKESYLISISDNVKSTFSQKKGIVIKTDNSATRIFYLPSDVSKITNNKEKYFSEIILDNSNSSNVSKKEKKYNLEDIQRILKECSQGPEITVAQIISENNLKEINNMLESKERNPNSTNSNEYETVLNTINNNLSEDINKIKTLKNNISTVQKKQIKPNQSFKLSKAEILDNLEIGNVIILNDFSGSPSNDSIRFLSKGINNDNIIELELTKKGTRSFQNFLKDFNGQKNFEIEKYFEIKTSNVDVETFNKILQQNTGKNTSSIIVGKQNLANNVDIFWDRTNNCLEKTFKETTQGKENMDSFIQRSLGKQLPIEIKDDIDFIFFERPEFKSKTMIKVEMMPESQKTEKKLYNLQWIETNEFGQSVINLKGIEFEKGNFIVNENYSKLNKTNLTISKAEELEIIKGTLACINFDISDSRDSIDAIKNNLSQKNETLQSAFKILGINGILKTEITELTETNNYLELLYSQSSTFKTTESQNLLITFLKEDNLIRRGPTDVDCDYMGDPISNKIIDIIETTIKNNPNLNTFKEVLENAFLTEENKDISVEDLNSFYEKLNNKVTEEVDIIRNFSKQENFNEYLMSIKSEEAHLTMSGCIESENILDKLQDSSKKADTINNTNDNTESAQQTGTQSIINKEDLSAIIRFITACKINEKEELSSNEKYNDYQAYFKQTKERLELKFNSGQIKEPFEKITNSINSGEFYKYIDIIKEVEASEKTASDSDLLELFKPQKELEIKINKDNTFTIEPKGIIEINKNGQEISIDFNSTFIKDPEKTKIEECIKNNLSDFNIEKTKDEKTEAVEPD